MRDVRDKLERLIDQPNTLPPNMCVICYCLLDDKDRVVSGVSQEGNDKAASENEIDVMVPSVNRIETQQFLLTSIEKKHKDDMELVSDASQGKGTEMLTVSEKGTDDMEPSISQVERCLASIEKKQEDEGLVSDVSRRADGETVTMSENGLDDTVPSIHQIEIQRSLNTVEKKQNDFGESTREVIQGERVAGATLLGLDDKFRTIQDTTDCEPPDQDSKGTDEIVVENVERERSHLQMVVGEPREGDVLTSGETLVTDISECRMEAPLTCTDPENNEKNNSERKFTETVDFSGTSRSVKDSLTCPKTSVVNVSEAGSTEIMASESARMAAVMSSEVGAPVTKRPESPSIDAENHLTNDGQISDLSLSPKNVEEPPKTSATKMPDRDLAKTVTAGVRPPITAETHVIKESVPDKMCKSFVDDNDKKREGYKRKGELDKMEVANKKQKTSDDECQKLDDASDVESITSQKTHEYGKCKQSDDASDTESISSMLLNSWRTIDDIDKIVKQAFKQLSEYESVTGLPKLYDPVTKTHLPYQCKFCSASFFFRQKCKEHVDNHVKSKLRDSQTCQERYHHNIQAKLVQVLRKERTEVPHDRTVDITSVKVALTDDIANMMATPYQPLRMYRCKQCEDVDFGVLKCFVKHLMECHGMTQIGFPWECKRCKKAFENKSGYEHHLCEGNLDKLQYECSIKGCKKMFVTEVQLIAHRRQNHAERPLYICSICGKRLQSNRRLKLHICNDHYNQRLSKCLQWAYKCLHCHRKFPTTSARFIHELMHKRKRRLARCQRNLKGK